MDVWARRMGIAILLLCLLFAVLLRRPATGAPRASGPSGSELNLDLQLHVPPGQLQSPVDIAHAGDSRLFVVERGGRIRVVRPDGSVQGPPFLDISGRVRQEVGTEQGLLGLAFDPVYKENGYFYVNYTAEPDGATHISRFSVSNDPNLADRNSELIILTIDQPYVTHNGGDLLFGPRDGYLYVPMGDGGGHNDPGHRAQDDSVLLGKVLRLDVHAPPGHDHVAADCGAPGNYSIPAGNPFVDGPGGACDEIWALGLRNPWRASFDRQTHDLIIADVGESQWEEINWQPSYSRGGENYGWHCYEGMQIVSSDLECQTLTSFAGPVYQYAHSTGDGCAVTGGYVYRGSRYPQMQSRYFLFDYCSGYLWDLLYVGFWSFRRYDHLQTQLRRAVTFGEDVFGELFLANIRDGAIYRLVEDTLVTTANPHLFLPLMSN